METSRISPPQRSQVPFASLLFIFVCIGAGRRLLPSVARTLLPVYLQQSEARGGEAEELPAQHQLLRSDTRRRNARPAAHLICVGLQERRAALHLLEGLVLLVPRQCRLVLAAPGRLVSVLPALSRVSPLAAEAGRAAEGPGWARLWPNRADETEGTRTMRERAVTYEKGE